MAHNTVLKEGCISLAFTDWVPYLYMDHAVGSVHGTMVNVLETIFNHLGYCFYFVHENMEGGGTRYENGTWTGVIGLIHRGEANMSGLGLGLTPERFREVDFSEYLYIDEMSAAYKRPVLQSDIMGFVKPYTAMMWVLIFVATAGVLGATCIVYRAHDRAVQQHSSEGDPGSWNLRESRKSPKISQESVVWTLSALLAQSVATPLRGGDSVRIVSGVWLLASLILATVYRSNLKAMLILPKLVLPFDSLEELVTTDLPVWVRIGSTAQDAILEADENTALGKLKKQMYYSNPFETIGQLEAGVHVLAIPRSSLHYMMHVSFSNTGKCITYVMSEGFMKTTALSFIFPKGSPLKKEIDPIIMRLRESGILDYLLYQAVSNATECLKNVRVTHTDSIRILVLGDFYGVFLVYAVGVIIASLTFIMEVLIHFTRKP